MRHLDVVVDAAGHRQAGQIVQVDASRGGRAELEQLVALDDVIAVLVETVEVERRIRERVRAADRRAELADVAVVGGPKQRALVGAEGVSHADARADAVPLQVARVARKIHRRQLRGEIGAVETGQGQRRGQDRIGRDRDAEVLRPLAIPAEAALDGEVAEQDGVSDVEVVVPLRVADVHVARQSGREAAGRQTVGDAAVLIGLRRRLRHRIVEEAVRRAG